MAVSLEGMVRFIGAGSVDETDLADDLAQAVDLLRGYVRHLRHTAEDGTVTRIVCTYDEAASSYTWTDERALEADELVPETVLDRATEQVAAELYARRDAPSGIVNTQFAGGGAVAGSGPARLHRDPLTPAYALLARWAVPF